MTGYSDNSLSIAVLRLLAEAKNKSPVAYKTIERYFKHGCESTKLYNCLEKLDKKKYINKTGTKKRYKYFISDSGISLLDKLDRKEFLLNMEHELSKYIRNICNGDRDL